MDGLRGEESGAGETVAARLHRALETYKIPKGHTGTLSPIFHDTIELTAHWVNEEIHLLRNLHGEAAILCLLAEGAPETAFPP